MTMAKGKIFNMALAQNFLKAISPISPSKTYSAAFFIFTQKALNITFNHQTFNHPS
jgi:hypothetical protein